VDTDELTAILQEVRDRVRARHPEGAAPAGALPDLMPLLHARDAAEAKMASIGTVNPRAGGPLNWLAQQAKKAIARALDWHVREQVEFNRNVMACVQATLEALEEIRRMAIQEEVRELKDIRSHWVDWRQEWEHKLLVNETKLLRGLAELNAAYQHRAGISEASFRDQVKSQHADFTAALERNLKRLWADLESVRLEYERLIHAELRMVRQRTAVSAAAAAAPAPPHPQGPALAPLEFDYGRFADRFRGPEEYVRKGQRFYLPYFTGRRAVLDIGCGRGEFLELMREAGVAARGIDLSRESVDLCRFKGLQADVADLFGYLADLPEASLDGIFSAQVVEHLPPERLPEMIRLAASRLERGGVLAIETPNPECLAIFASHFYLDPTHTRPVPHALLAFYLEEYGMGGIEVHRLSPASESMPALAGLPEDFREAFFGGLDYAIVGRKL
jgi:2-polyprenyl-3-methyl-5-hydroxy-6-metoxy-1,4-benzoquinol methylase